MPAPVNPNRSLLDATQILQRVMDESTDKLRVDADLKVDSITGELEIEIDAASGDNISIANADGSKKVTVTTIGSNQSLDVNVTNSALPAGAATSANQSTGNASLASIDTKLTSPLTVTGPLTNTQLRASAVPVSVSGVSTSALQTSGNASLTSIDSKLTSPLTVTGPLTNTQLRATPVPVSGTVTSNQGTPAITADAWPSKITDGINTAAITSNGEVKVVNGLRSGGTYGVLSIPLADTPVEVKIGASRLANRKSLMISITTTGLFLGLDSSVTVSNGIPLTSGQMLQFDCDPDGNFEVWLVGNAVSQSATVMEIP